MSKITDVLAVIPEEFALPLGKAFEIPGIAFYEIRLIAGNKMYLVCSEGIRFVSSSGALSGVPDMSAPTVTHKTLEELTDRAAGYSAYAHSEELRQGFITYGNGFRIGVASKGYGGVGGKINSVCIRLPTEAPEINEPVLDGLLEEPNGGLLIAGPPGSGKTTLLRYCAKKLSDGGASFRKVAVIDERMELAGTGLKGFDLGMCTDIISGKPKAEGILIALRCFSPDIVICDEIGSAEEADSILEGLNSGVVFVSSMHSGNISQLTLRSQFRRLFDENVFSSVALLSDRKKGAIEKIYSRKAVCDEICRSFDNGDIVALSRRKYNEPLKAAY